MPTYHFRCSGCQHDFSIQMPMGSTEMPACQTCKSATQVAKVIRPPMVHFKGSGFYKTDSASNTRSSSAETPKEAKSSTKAEASQSFDKAPSNQD